MTTYEVIDRTRLDTIATAFGWTPAAWFWDGGEGEGYTLDGESTTFSDKVTAKMVAESKRPYDYVVEYRRDNHLITALFDRHGEKLTYWVFRIPDEDWTQDPIWLARIWEYFPEGHSGLYLNERWLLGSIVQMLTD